jgi:Right handed beta helix region
MTLSKILVSNCFGALALLLTTTATEAATTIYVSPSGSNANPGTQAAPLASPQRAVDLAVAGDTVVITAGVYDVGGGLRIANKIGTASAPITVQGQGSAIFRDTRQQVPVAYGGLIMVFDSSHIKVRGLRVENSAFYGMTVANSNNVLIEANTSRISMASALYVAASSNITVRGNDMSRFCDKGAIVSGYGCQEGISISDVNTFDVAENIVHDAPMNPGAGPGGGEGIDAKGSSRNGTIRYNRVFNLIQLAIYVDAWDKIAENIKVYGNIVYNNANGIVVAAENGGTVRNVDIFNNIVYENGLAGVSISGALKNGPRQNIRIYHNTIVRNGYKANKPAWANQDDYGQGIHIDSANISGILVANNILFDNSLGQIIPRSGLSAGALTVNRNLSFPPGKNNFSGEVLGANPLTTDPLFANRLSADFHLRSGSPAIGVSSTSSPRPTDDAERKARAASGALDLGALAFSTAPPIGGEIVLDNAALGLQDVTGGRNFTGLWCKSEAANKYGLDSLYSCGPSSDTYRWTPTITTAGNYDVYIWWSTHPNRAASVPITVTSLSGNVSKNFNQKAGGGQWVLHGRYNFAAGKSGFVQVSDANGQGCADAVRWVRVP